MDSLFFAEKTFPIMKLLRKEIMPVNASATDFGKEVLWVAGVFIGATIVITAANKAGRKVVRKLKNRKK